MLYNEIDLIFEKYKNIQSTDEDSIDVKKSDLNKDGKLSKYEMAKGRAIDKAQGGDGKLPLATKTEDEEIITQKTRKKLGSFEKYKLGQAKRFLKNNEKIRKMLSHMGGMTEKEAKKIVKQYS
jgi:hypothetical protein